jgi:hypothetical protein
MKGKLLSLFIVCLCITGFYNSSKAQSLYEIKFTDAAQPLVEYNCLLVYFNEQNSYMRVAYTQNQNYYVVHVDYRSITGVNSQNANYFYLKGSNPTFITTNKSNYRPDYFIWYGEKGGKQTGPYTTDLDDFSGQHIAKSYKQLKPSELTETYLKQYFSASEDKYLAMRKICGLDKSIYESLQLNIPNTKLHFIMAANTRVSDIGLGCTIDERAMENEFRDIAKTLNIDFAKYTVMDDNYSRQNLDDILNKLSVGKNDVVVFAYSGHGFRWHDQTDKYPMIDLRSSAYMSVSNSTSASMSDIYRTITAKGARLNLLLSDCCNSDIGRNQQTSAGFLNAKSDVSPNQSNLRKLFLTAKGNIITTASQPGEYSWGNNTNGGFFTTSFIQALREEISYFKIQSPSWESLIKRTTELAKYKTSPGVCKDCQVQNSINYMQVSY